MFFSFWPHSLVCGILVPWPGIRPVAPVLEAWSLNYWTTKEAPKKESALDRVAFLLFMESRAMQNRVGQTVMFKSFYFKKSSEFYICCTSYWNEQEIWTVWTRKHGHELGNMTETWHCFLFKATALTLTHSKTFYILYLILQLKLLLLFGNALVFGLNVIKYKNLIIFSNFSFDFGKSPSSIFP